MKSVSGTYHISNAIAVAKGSVVAEVRRLVMSLEFFEVEKLGPNFKRAFDDDTEESLRYLQKLYNTWEKSAQAT